MTTKLFRLFVCILVLMSLRSGVAQEAPASGQDLRTQLQTLAGTVVPEASSPNPAYTTLQQLSVTSIPNAMIENAWLADINGDGLTDVIAFGGIGSSESTATPYIFVWLQQSGGSYSAPIQTQLSSSDLHLRALDIYGTAIGDLDGDGLPDFATTIPDPACAGAGTCVLRFTAIRNTGGGHFSNTSSGNLTVPTVLRSNTMHIGDFNGDGHNDVVIDGFTSQDTSHNFIITFLGNGSLSGSSVSAWGAVKTTFNGYQPIHYVESVADFNGDGKLDLAVTNESGSNPSPTSLLYGNGSGGFATSGPNLPNNMDCSIGDFFGTGQLSCAGIPQTFYNYSGSEPPLSLYLLQNVPSNTTSAVQVSSASAIPADYYDFWVNDSLYSPPVLPAVINYGGSPYSLAVSSSNRVYFLANDGHGNFSAPVQAIPDFTGSGYCTTTETWCLIDVKPGGTNLQSYLLFFDNSWNADYSTGLVVAEGSSPTTTTVSTSNPTVYYGATVTFTATVTSGSGTPTGGVTFFADGNSIGTGTLSNGSASITNNSLSIGTHQITATYGGSSSFPSSTSSAITQTITKIPTGLTFTLNPNPSIVTNTFNVQIQVTAANGSIPSGSVSVVADGGNTLGNPSLSGSGAASLGVSSLPVGQHSITVSYPGTSTYDSSSQEQTQTVNAIPTSTAVTANPASSTYLSCVTFTATVTATEGTPTGSVSFSAKAGNNAPVSIGSAPLNGSGVASASSCSLTPATYTVTASYGGASNYGTSSGTTNETVTTLSVPTLPPSPPSGSGPHNPGNPITIPVGGFPTPPGGVSPTQPIEIFNGGTPIGTVPPSGGTIIWTPPGTGSFPIGSCYPGDADYANTCPPTNPITVTITAPTTLTVSALPNPVTFGQSANVTATVSSSYGTPTGTVTCSSDSGSFGTSPVGGNGTATFTTGVLSVGSHNISCNYTPSGYFDPSSGSGSETVIKATPTVTVTVSPEPTYPGDYGTLTATVHGVSAATPTGTVTFLIDNSAVGSASLNGGTASLSGLFATVGSHTVTAQYGGDGNYNTATGSYTHSVVKLPTTTIVSSTPNPGIGGLQVITVQSVSTYPDLEPGTPNQRQPMSGTVTFYDGATVLGSVAINPTTELASIAVPSMTVGTHNFSAIYSGDANYTNSSSGGFSETIVPPISGITVSGNGTSADVSANVTWSAQVVNPLKQPQPSGTVTWIANGQQLGTSQVGPDGTTSFTTSFPTPGIYSVTANYAGQQEPGTLTFSQTILSTGTDGSAPFAMATSNAPTMANDGTTQFAIAFTSAGVTTPVALSCTGAPEGYSCAVNPSTITLSDATKQPTVTVSVTRNATTTQAQMMNKTTISMAGFGIGILGVFGLRKRRRSFVFSVLAVVLMLPGLSIIGCGALGGSAAGPSSYSLTVTATTATYSQSIIVAVKH